MTEFGRSNLLKVPELASLGINIVIYPVTLLRLALHAAENGLNILQREGTQESLLGSMQTRAELYELLQYKEYARFDQQIYNFKL
jgi:methylisocitrate lyase